MRLAVHTHRDALTAFDLDAAPTINPATIAMVVLLLVLVIGDSDRAEIENASLSPSDWTMSPVRSGLVAAAGSLPEVERLLADRLGEGWAADTEVAVYVRNVAAHGRVFSADPSELVTEGVEWKRDHRIFLAQILSALELFGRFVNDT